jgi:hypothetical protein
VVYLAEATRDPISQRYAPLEEGAYVRPPKLTPAAPQALPDSLHMGLVLEAADRQAG